MQWCGEAQRGTQEREERGSVQEFSANGTEMQKECRRRVEVCSESLERACMALQ